MVARRRHGLIFELREAAAAAYYDVVFDQRGSLQTDGMGQKDIFYGKPYKENMPFNVSNLHPPFQATVWYFVFQVLIGQMRTQ